MTNLDLSVDEKLSHTFETHLNKVTGPFVGADVSAIGGIHDIPQKLKRTKGHRVLYG